MANARVSLEAPLNRKWFDEAMDKLEANFDSLSDYDKGLYNDMLERRQFPGWSPTVKQFNYIRQIASRL